VGDDAEVADVCLVHGERAEGAPFTG